MTGNRNSDQRSSRVLVLSDHRGQLDRRIAAQVNTLAASGRAVTLVSVPTAIGEGLLDSRVRVVMPAAAQLRAGAAAKHRAAGLPEPLKRTLWRLWYLAAANLPRPLVPEFDMHNLALFGRLAPLKSPAVIHCHDLSTLLAGIMLRRKLNPAAKLVYDSHELYPYQWPSRNFRKYWSGVEAEAIAQADLVITINPSVAGHLARSYGLERVEVIYNSFADTISTGQAHQPLEPGEFLEHFQAPDGGFKIVTHVGSLHHKNSDDLVRAFGHLDSDMRLFLLADAASARRLARLCRRRGISNVFFGDWVSPSRVLDYLARADLGVIPYRGDRVLNHRLCSPNKLFEYIEAEVPVCASDLPELRRLIMDNGIGRVYPMNNAGQIAEALRDCRRRVQAGEFTARVLEQARRKYQWSTQGEKLLRLYDEMGV